MPELVPIALVAWIPIVVGLFTWFEPRRAVMVAFIAGFLFLPQGQIVLAGLPELTRTASTSIGVLIGALLLDTGRVVGFRPRWVDIPMILWCLAPLASSMANKIGDYGGVYDGASAVLGQLLEWGIPYFMARIYITNMVHLRELAMGILIGGLIYVPLCLIEVRLSPQLHNFIYGFHPTHFGMTVRWGGYRPMVFLQHGLMLGMWMTAASIVAVWLWYSRSYKQVYGVPSVIVMLAIGGTAVLCKSTGALVLLIAVLGMMFVVRRLRMPALVYAAVLAAPIYMTTRVNDWWDVSQVIDLAMMVDEERATSLEGRIENESLIAAKAMDRKWFGWGQWGRWRVYDQYTGKDITVADGMWIITLGQTGLVGLISLCAALLLPVWLLVRTIPVQLWATPAGGPPAALAGVLLAYMFDLLPNAMLSPVYLLIAGGLAGLYVGAPSWRRRVAHARKMRGRASYRSTARQHDQHSSPQSQHHYA